MCDLGVKPRSWFGNLLFSLNLLDLRSYHLSLRALILAPEHFRCGLPQVVIVQVVSFVIHIAWFLLFFLFRWCVSWLLTACSLLLWKLLSLRRRLLFASDEHFSNVLALLCVINLLLLVSVLLEMTELACLPILVHHEELLVLSLVVIWLLLPFRPFRLLLLVRVVLELQLLKLSKALLRVRRPLLRVLVLLLDWLLIIIEEIKVALGFGLSQSGCAGQSIYILLLQVLLREET